MRFPKIWHHSAMTRDPDAALTPSEFNSLKELAWGPLAKAVPDADRAKLLKLGLIMQSSLGYPVTEAGQMRLQKVVQ